MSQFTLQHHNRAELTALLSSDQWVVACLCAAWCDVCGKYQADFDQLSALHPDKHFIWIDIEDHADLVGDLDVENFPTLLIQHNDLVAFYGTVMPDLHIADRLIAAQTEKSGSELLAESASNATRQTWQREANLRKRLTEASSA